MQITICDAYTEGFLNSLQVNVNKGRYVHELAHVLYTDLCQFLKGKCEHFPLEEHTTFKFTTGFNSLKVNVNEITIVSDMEFNDSPISFQFLKGKCDGAFGEGWGITLEYRFQFLKGKCDLRQSAASVRSISQRVRRSAGVGYCIQEV